MLCPSVLRQAVAKSAPHFRPAASLHIASQSSNLKSRLETLESTPRQQDLVRQVHSSLPANSKLGLCLPPIPVILFFFSSIPPKSWKKRFLYYFHYRCCHYYIGFFGQLGAQVIVVANDLRSCLLRCGDDALCCCSIRFGSYGCRLSCLATSI
jgi:hypothetical protein